MKKQDFIDMYGKKLLFRPDEVMDMLSCSRAHIYNLIDKGALVVPRDSAGLKKMPIRIRMDSIIDYLSTPEDTI